MNEEHSAWASVRPKKYLRVVWCQRQGQDFEAAEPYPIAYCVPQPYPATNRVCSCRRCGFLQTTEFLFVCAGGYLEFHVGEGV